MRQNPENLQAPEALGDLPHDDVAGSITEQSCAHGRENRDFVWNPSRLAGVNEAIRPFGAGVEVAEVHGGVHGDQAGGNLSGFDNIGAIKFLLQLRQTVLIDAGACVVSVDDGGKPLHVGAADGNSIPHDRDMCNPEAKGTRSEWASSCSPPGMTLKARLCLSTSAVVLVLFGVSEWLSYQQTSQFLAEHEKLLEETGAEAALAAIRIEKDTMFRSVTAVRLIHAVATVLVSVLLLNALWYKMMLRPLNRLLSHVNIMKRGTWENPIPVRRDDEMGQLVEAFNDLGKQLTLTVHQYAAASKLAALSLIGQRMIRRIRLAADHMENTGTLLEVSRSHGLSVPGSAIKNLELAARDLRDLETEFEIEFNNQLKREGELAAAGKES